MLDFYVSFIVVFFGIVLLGNVFVFVWVMLLDYVVIICLCLIVLVKLKLERVGLFEKIVVLFLVFSYVVLLFDYYFFDFILV